MDHFGIGAAMEAMANVYFHSGRQSGRTTLLVESVKTGDRIIFGDRREAERVRRLCLDRGAEVECVVLSPLDAHSHRIAELGSLSGDGRTIFDHSWVEGYYAEQIRRAREGIDAMERMLSGSGEAHRKTRRQAELISRWRLA